MSPPKPACYSENERACAPACVGEERVGVGAREEGTGRVGEQRGGGVITEWPFPSFE